MYTSHVPLSCWHVSVRRLHLRRRASQPKSFTAEEQSKIPSWRRQPARNRRISWMDPSAERQSFLQLFSDMSVSLLNPPKHLGVWGGGFWVKLNFMSSMTRQTKGNIVDISRLRACRYRFGKCFGYEGLGVFFGFVAVNWKMNDDFALFSCTVDVSDANVCHRVLICRWHACLDPPALRYVRFCQIWRHLPLYFYNMDIMHWYRDRYI